MKLRFQMLSCLKATLPKALSLRLKCSLLVFGYEAIVLALSLGLCLAFQKVVVVFYLVLMIVALMMVLMIV